MFVRILTIFFRIHLLAKVLRIPIQTLNLLGRSKRGGDVQEERAFFWARSNLTSKFEANRQIKLRNLVPDVTPPIFTIYLNVTIARDSCRLCAYLCYIRLLAAEVWPHSPDNRERQHFLYPQRFFQALILCVCTFFTTRQF